MCRECPPFYASIVVASFCVLSFAGQDRGNARASDPASIHFVVEEVSYPALPYQAVRIRLAISNKGGKRLGPVQLVDVGAMPAEIQGPGDKAFEKVSGTMLPLDLEHHSGLSMRSHRNEALSLFLEPSEQSSVTIALAAQWQAKDGSWTPLGKSLFPRAGDYKLKCTYRGGPGGAVSHEATLSITVREPAGIDKAVFELLEGDAELASALMSPVHVPTRGLVAKLQDLLQQYPNSGYQDYIRFALARGYARGVGVKPSTLRVINAWTADALETMGSRFDARAQRNVHVHFAYQPQALILRAKVDTVAREASLMHLHRYLTDSLEWMEEFADLFVRQKYDDLGLLLGRPVPQGDKSFPSKAWETFRKQRPAPPTAPMPGPTKKVMMFIVIPLAVVGFALTGWWLARRRSQPQRAV